MDVLEFKIEINASPQKVWETLWNDATYREWTAVFNPSSHAISDWNENSKIQFLDAEGNGMHSIIEKKIPNKEMVFKHIGEMKNGVEVDSTWGEGRERYFLNETASGTELLTVLDLPMDFKKYFTEVFPKALQLIKQISETDN
ncbi:MAG: SRPBCC domain-containing protein [Bacteroidota bacterium]|nr:SRPBCC domain-containing protein [Bacteroidota bacterium]